MYRIFIILFKNCLGVWCCVLFVMPARTKTAIWVGVMTGGAGGRGTAAPAMATKETTTATARKSMVCG